jgi:hypothetical protein
MTKSLGIFITSILLLLCLAVAFPFWSLHRREAAYARKAHQDLLREVRLTRAAGISLDRALLKQTLPPTTDNAWPIYQEIAVELKVHRVDLLSEDRLMKLAKNPTPTPAEMALRKAFLHQNARLLRLTHLAVAKSDCTIDTNWDTPNPQDIRFTEMGAMREASRMIQNESQQMASEGRVAEAIQNQALGFRIADHCAAGNRYFTYVIANSINSITLEGMRNILEFHGNDPTTAKAVRLAIQRSAHTPDLSAMLRTETVVGYLTIEYFRTASVQDFQTLSDHYVVTAQDVATLTRMRQNTNFWNAYLDSIETGLLQRDRADIASADLPLPVSFTQIVQHAAAFEKRKGAASPMANVLNLDTANLASLRSYNTGLINVLKASASILIWKSQHGAFPETLSVIGKTPLDPFSGKPFGYRREGSGFVLYSAGVNGNFNGGSPNVKPKGGPPMFRYPVPAYYRLPAKAEKTP